MTIYNIFDYCDQESFRQEEQLLCTSSEMAAAEEKSGLFSIIAARFFFFLLLIADIAWGLYTTFSLLCKLVLTALTFNHFSSLNASLAKSWLSFKRAIVCGLSLIVALFSPALGIMFSCIYFLMYDKSGVEEIVPSSLRDQFKDIFPIK